VLPAGFHRIRYYGFLGNRVRREKLERCRELLQLPPQLPAEHELTSEYEERHQVRTSESLRICPVCVEGHMHVIERLLRPRPAFTDTS
jgi:hypothetical protein